jgi:hypothetical protein
VTGETQRATLIAHGGNTSRKMPHTPKKKTDDARKSLVLSSYRTLKQGFRSVETYSRLHDRFSLDDRRRGAGVVVCMLAGYKPTSGVWRCPASKLRCRRQMYASFLLESAAENSPPSARKKAGAISARPPTMWLSPRTSATLSTIGRR